MKLRERLHGMSRRQRFDYLWEYYKWFFLLIILAAGIMLYTLTAALSKKKTELTVALVNVGISDEILDPLTNQFLEEVPGASPNGTIRYERNLLIENDQPEASPDPAADSSDSTATGRSSTTADSREDNGVSYEYSYASQMKLLAMITDKKLDVVIMDQNTRDIFQRQAYLSDCISLNGTFIYQKAGFSAPVYAGILRNTQRPESAEKFLKILSNH